MVVFIFPTLDKKQQELLTNICDWIKTKTNEEIVLWDVFFEEREINPEDVLIVFGDRAYNQIKKDVENKIFKAKSFQKMISDPECKRDTLKTLQEALEWLETQKDKELVVSKGDVTIGFGGQIQLTEKEVEYLVNLKEILGGGDILITKGDLTLEIKERKD
jgi:calcineurin-like phosphoesterase family protein